MPSRSSSRASLTLVAIALVVLFQSAPALGKCSKSEIECLNDEYKLNEGKKSYITSTVQNKIYLNDEDEEKLNNAVKNYHRTDLMDKLVRIAAGDTSVNITKLLDEIENLSYEMVGDYAPEVLAKEHAAKARKEMAEAAKKVRQAKADALRASKEAKLAHEKAERLARKHGLDNERAAQLAEEEEQLAKERAQEDQEDNENQNSPRPVIIKIRLSNP